MEAHSILQNRFVDTAAEGVRVNRDPNRAMLSVCLRSSGEEI